MAQVIPCPDCDKNVKVPDDVQGKKFRCPGCQAVLLGTEEGLQVSRKPAVQAVGAKAARKSAPVDDEEEAVRSKRHEDGEAEKPRKKKKKRRSGVPLWVWLASGSAACVLVLG